MFVPLKVTTDYSLLSSLIKIEDLVKYLQQNNINVCGICDVNLYGVMEFYNTLTKNNIKPLIGLEVNLSPKIYLYAKNYLGYQNLLKINTLITNDELNFDNLVKYKENLILVIPCNYQENYSKFVSYFTDIYLGYINALEKDWALKVSDKVVYIPDIKAFKKEDMTYLKYLEIIKNNKATQEYNLNYFPKQYEITEYDQNTTNEFASKINIVIPKDNHYIPKFSNKITDSYNYLINLAKKGLSKRLDNNVSPKYVTRLKYELETINKMGFVDYFLIVYDYVLFAKKNNILVGVGRGSAAGSLVSYSLGITDIDPLKYDLLFERFLNPERITMPDIDIDFEYTKRNQVIDYVKEKYGYQNVAGIMTYSTLTSKAIIRDIGKILNIDSSILNRFLANITAKASLKENMQKELIKKYLNNYPELKKMYQICLKLENIKRQVSTHAAGVVISSVNLDTVIPTYNNNGELLTGVTMNYLEDLGLLKMDFLSIKNLTIIQNLLTLIKKETNEEIKLNNLSLDDELTYRLFQNADTDGVFQFESQGMKNFLLKLKPSCFEDLIAALALFRPGPMANIDTYIRRKEHKETVTYLHPLLKPILCDTYGIIVYQEQIMFILVNLADYSFAEADNIRRAMSKKKLDVMTKEKEKFIIRATKKGIDKKIALEIYDLIIKFANYGFNKSHSVGYALIGYQMAYLKSHYPILYMINLLNMNMESEIKIKEYLDDAKLKGLTIIAPKINISKNEFLIKDNAILLPLTIIKNLGNQTINVILDDIDNNGQYQDYLDFVKRAFLNKISKKTIELLIYAGVLDDFKLNRKTMIENLDIALNYGSLVADLDEEYVIQPEITEYNEYLMDELRSQEIKSYGYYITNHPASKYNSPDIVKSNKLSNYFSKQVKCVAVVDNIRIIKTKNNEEMAFISASDETGIFDFVLFPRVSRKKI